MHPPERRQRPRFQGSVPVEIEKERGITRDFSASGVFFETDRLFSPGDRIKLALLLEHWDPGRLVRIWCQGEVVRVEPAGKKLGVAMAISSYRLERGGQNSH